MQFASYNTTCSRWWCFCKDELYFVQRPLRWWLIWHERRGEEFFHVLSAKLLVVLLEERAQALLSSLLGVPISSSSRRGVRLLTPLQDVDHVVATGVHRFVQRRVSPSVARKTALEWIPRLLTRPSEGGLTCLWGLGSLCRPPGGSARPPCVLEAAEKWGGWCNSNSL